jgi:hypothetical protein
LSSASSPLIKKKNLVKINKLRMGTHPAKVQGKKEHK